MRKNRFGKLVIDESELNDLVAQKVAEKLGTNAPIKDATPKAPKTIRMTESQLVDKIERIVQEVKSKRLSESRTSTRRPSRRPSRR